MTSRAICHLGSQELPGRLRAPLLRSRNGQLLIGENHRQNFFEGFLSQLLHLCIRSVLNRMRYEDPVWVKSE